MTHCMQANQRISPVGLTRLCSLSGSQLAHVLALPVSGAERRQLLLSSLCGEMTVEVGQVDPNTRKPRPTSGALLHNVLLNLISMNVLVKIYSFWI